MKTNRYLLLCLAMFVCLTVSAHAPKKVNVEYNTKAGKLSVAVSHPVKDVSDHYIESLVIKVNGEEVKTIDYTKQSKKESENVSVKLPGLAAGDEISVVAKCNKMGSKTGKTTVE